MKWQSFGVILVAVICLSRLALAFEEIGPPVNAMDYNHAWKVPPVSTKIRSKNNVTGKEGYSEYVEVTETTRTIRVGNSTCLDTRPLHPFAPAIEFEGCGSNGDRKGGQEFWMKGEIFPMKKGGKWKFYTRNLQYTERGESIRVPGKQTHKCEVKDEVRVRTIAGEFDTFKVECDAGFEVRTYYYSPEVGDAVAFRREKPIGNEDRNSEWLGTE